MNRKKKIFLLSAFIVFFIILNFYPLPYYVSRPGIAKVLDEVIDVENGTENEGEFMLTTIRMGKANVFSYLMTKFNKYYDLHPEETVRLDEESDEEYEIRQLYYMENSKENALQVAFEKAGKEIDVKMEGIYVLNVKENMPAYGKLEPGDRIIEIDQRKIRSVREFTDYVQKTKKGDTVHMTIIRDDQKLMKNVKVDILPETNKPGIGIILAEDKEVRMDPEVQINTEEIGGPSAGLMFALEIYNQLVEEDITKGYRIAGTGTISPDGSVGPIGGIEQKVVAADREGAEIFFAPNEQGAADSNFVHAYKTARDIGSEMKIVPVDSFNDALDYLAVLKDKES